MPRLPSAAEHADARSVDIRKLRRELPHAGPVLRVAQITDTHLEEQMGGTLLGMNTDASLAHVIALLRAAPQPPHLILATGDLANHGSRAAYARIRQVFDGLQIPWFWLPGNHDDRDAMRECLGDGTPAPRSLCVGGWHIVMLDSTIPGQVGGHLGDTELQLLEELLLELPTHPTLVCLHHQPLPIGCAWLDDQKVRDGAQFLDLLGRFPQVRGVLWGHVHQEFQRESGGVKLMASPSTCIQFAAMSAAFLVDEKSPGMRWLDLHPDGSLDTRVERVSGVTFSFDRDSAGYM